MPTPFKRDLSPMIIGRLKKDPLFTSKLIPDIESGKVFPAIRYDWVDFYHRGGRLMSYGKEGFITHQKYVSVIDSPVKPYLNETALRRSKLISTFDNGYSRMKELCALYAGVEAQGVSFLLERFSAIKIASDINMHEDVVAIDIEAAMWAPINQAAGWDESDPDNMKKDERKIDRIDLVLLNNKTNKIHFVEAKYYSNKELWASDKHTPPIVKQIDRYQKQINKRKNQIIDAYKNHVTALNSLLNPVNPLPLPQDVSDIVGLYLFGFDNDQKNGRLESGFKNKPEVIHSGIHIYSKGDPKSIKHLNQMVW